MSKNRTFLLPVSVLILALIACSMQATPPATTDINAAGTAVVQTLTAQAVIPVSGSTATSPSASATAAAPTNTVAPSPTQVCDSAQFISETVPDGTLEPAGAAFTKSWRLKNIGACTWTSSYAAVFSSGDAMNALATVPLSGNVAPGQEVDISVNLQAPTTPGTYTGYWKLRNASSVIFGLGPSNGTFWVKISVPAPSATATSSGGPILHLPLTLVPLPPLFIPNTQQVLNQVTAPAGGIGNSGVSCPSGTLVTGGGFAGNTNLLVYNTSATGSGWQVYAQNTSGSGQLLNAYAMCLSHVSGSTQQVYGQVSVAAGGTGQATVACPSGSTVTGGGFAGNTNLLVYNTSANGNGWQVYAENTSGSSQLLNAYAVCLSGASSSSQQVLAQVTAPNGGIGHAVAGCPSGSLLTGGGYATGGFMTAYSDAATGSTWEVDGQNNTGASQLFNAYAICLTLH